MAFASFCKPSFLKQFRNKIGLQDRGSYHIETGDFEALFGPARLRGASLEPRHFDIAHSLQKALEETVLSLARWLYLETQSDQLCLAGGVALNCVMNARLRDESSFSDIWVQPAAGDAGTALGAALCVDLEERR